jgi:prolyl oligopeptidase
MTKHCSTLAGALALTAALVLPGVAPAQNGLADGALRYPDTRKGDQVDSYHGIKVSDPYRWLEDTDSPATARWVEAQNALTFGYLERIPERPRIKQRLTELWNYPKYGVPVKRGGLYFFYENSGLQNQSVVYVQRSLGDRPRVLLDPNQLSADGTVALTFTEPSDNGRFLAYGVSASGSDWLEIRVRNVATGKDLPETLKWVKFSDASWTKDNEGFFYSRYDEPKGGNALLDLNKNHKLYYHRIGRPQSEDVLVYERPDQPDWGFSATVTQDGRYAIITVWQGTDTRNRLYYIDLDDPGDPAITAPVVKLIDDLEAAYTFVHNINTNFFIQTDLEAPRGRLISIDIDNRMRRHWLTVIPQHTDALESVDVIGNRFAAKYLHDAYSAVRLYEIPRVFMLRMRRGARPTDPDRLKGSVQAEPRGEIALPGIGSVAKISGRAGEWEAFYSFTSYLQPTTIFRLNVRDGRSQAFRQPKLTFDASRYETTQVFYASQDGTRIPMFITARKDLKLDGKNPTLLYGYGGFNVAMTPAYSTSKLVWLEMGGVYAVANLRGGGEYGKEWHEAGRLLEKQNVFDDFIAAAEFLVKERYTSPQRLAIQGGSNGGLLVGAVMTQRPDLFGVALPAVGVMDMLRFHKFTIGWAWTSDYGSSDDSTQFEYLRGYSPLHNLEPGVRYPATLVTTADHDDRVVPGHSFKFAAMLQSVQAGPAPVLIRIDTKAGHGAGKPTSKQIDLATDELAFAVKNLGMSEPVRP